MSQALDSFFMKRCLALARKGAGHTAPNPMVGALVVKNKKILAAGYHHQWGAPHAEIEALYKLNKNKLNAKGATLYCNLEPCFHQGKTPPCVHPVIQSGIKRVVIAHLDPNPLVAGKSVQLMRKAGIEVVVGVLEDEARYLNRIFLKWIQTKRPYVLLKLAISLDGKIAQANKQKNAPVYFTNAKARACVHQLRAEFASILVGSQTALVDRPQLNVRGIKGAHQPVRLVLDQHQKVPLTDPIFSSAGGATYQIVKKQEARNQIECAVNRQGEFDLKKLLSKIAKLGWSSVMVEGGAKLAHSFLSKNLVDEIILFVSPVEFGPSAPGGFNEIFGSKKLPFNVNYLVWHDDNLELGLIKK